MRRAGEGIPLEVRAQTKADDGQVAHVGQPVQLAHLRGRQKLCFIDQHAGQAFFIHKLRKEIRGGIEDTGLAL